MWIKRLALGVVGLSLIAGFFMPATSFALFSSSQNEACQGLNLNGSAANNTCQTGTTQFGRVLRYIINLFTIIVGVTAVIMIIVAGMKFITAGGESSAVAAARSTLIYAVIGLLVAALAQVIAHFTLAQSNQITQSPPQSSTSQQGSGRAPGSPAMQ